MGPINEAGFAPGWFQRGHIGCAHDWGADSQDIPSGESGIRVHKKGQPRDPDQYPLPYRTKSLIAMLRRKLEAQQERREFYYRNGKMIERVIHQ